ncbi:MULTISPECIES: alpha/beta hydrolase [Olivibacter]|uniref:Alpha/beta hydrolase n=1 Tax=Olivibacter jilunii TaxID=985016 RepID=A0ABW6B3D9_9SPHI|nr:alpha/beta hydrolase-fold protein [Olivibacter sp. UJ_SKK_5.1]MDX3915310.1 alpha/beta hydrolase-fold protein [Pseudosphingobacterium sp.]
MGKKIYILIALIGLVSLCLAQENKNQRFETFVQKLEGTVVEGRPRLVEQYLSQIKSTPIIEKTENVHFIWYGKAEKLEIEGDLQKAWAIPEVLNKIDCGEQDFFYISYTIPSDAIIEYRFIVDGKRSVDTRNPKITQSFDYGNRNIFSMPGFIRSPYVDMRSDIEKGVANTLVFKTDDSLFTDRLIWVYTPFNYTKDKEYPVLYVHDGMWAMYLRPFINVLDNLIHDRKIEPIVVVFVAFEDRWNEYVTQSAEYAKLIVNKLIPFIEENFQVSSFSHGRGIMGASAGGHSAIVTALRYPEFFGNVSSQGGGAGGYPGLNKLANDALDVYLTKRDKYPLKNIYTEVGTYDLEFPDQKTGLLDGARQFHKRMQENDIIHVYKEVNSGHAGDSWDQRIDDILIQFYGK